MWSGARLAIWAALSASRSVGIRGRRSFILMQMAIALWAGTAGAELLAGEPATHAWLARVPYVGIPCLPRLWAFSPGGFPRGIQPRRLPPSWPAESHDPAPRVSEGDFSATAPTLSPAFARIGPIVEFQPASILQLWASYEVLYYFGGFNFLQSFASPRADFSDTELERRNDLPKNDPQTSYAASGTQLNLGGTAQIKIGPIAVRNLFRAMRPDYDARAGDRVVYDILFDTLVPDGGWFLNNDVDALYVTRFGLSAGARWTANYAFYRSQDYAAGEDASQNPNTPMHRVGPVIAYSFWKDRGGAFDNPTILLIANWWLEHRWRTGADVSRGVPYLAFGFQFTGELLQPPPPSNKPLNGLPYEEIPVAPADPRLER